MSERFPTGEPATLPEIRDGLARMHGAAEAYLATLPDPAFVAPQGPKWSPSDHVRHLTRSMLPVAQGLALPKLLLRLRFGRTRTPGRSFAELREAYRQRLRDGVQAGRFAPPPREVPDPGAFRREVMERWRSAGAALDRATARWSEAAADRQSLPHPALGRISVREMLFFSLYHEAHHLRLVAERAGPAEAGPVPFRQATAAE